MKRIALAIVLTVALLRPLLAQDSVKVTRGWTTEDKMFAVASTALLVIDWGQTKWGLLHGRSEVNPLWLAGRTPQQRINIYSVAVITANLVLAQVLPPKLRHVSLILVTGMEAFSVFNNGVTNGVGIRLPL